MVHALNYHTFFECEAKKEENLYETVSVKQQPEREQSETSTYVHT